MVPFDAVKLTKSQQIIADYITKNQDVIPYLTEQDIADACSLSVATVSRFWGSVGYDSLKSYKLSYKKETPVVTPAKKMESTWNKYENTHLLNMFNATMGYMEETLKHLSNEDFERSVQSLSEASSIYIFGSGPSHGLASLLRFRLRRFNLKIHTFTHSGHELFEDLIHMKQNDVLIVFGFVQASPEIQVLFDHAVQQQITTILITDVLVAPMLNQANYVLYTERGELGEFHSMVAPTALVESLVVAVGQKLGSSALNKLDELHQIRKKYATKLPKH